MPFLYDAADSSLVLLLLKLKGVLYTSLSSRGLLQLSTPPALCPDNSCVLPLVGSQWLAGLCSASATWKWIEGLCNFSLLLCIPAGLSGTPQSPLLVLHPRVSSRSVVWHGHGRALYL